MDKFLDGQSTHPRLGLQLLAKCRLLGQFGQFGKPQTSDTRGRINCDKAATGGPMNALSFRRNVPVSVTFSEVLADTKEPQGSTALTLFPYMSSFFVPRPTKPNVVRATQTA